MGKVCEVTSDNSYSRTITYDGFGRTSQIGTTFDTAIYNVDSGYDSSSRLSQTTYPTGFIAKYVYNSFGYLSQLTDSSGATVYWQANTLSASGQVLTETLGNGLTTTRTYDVVDRPLTNVVSGTGGAVQNFNYTWDDVGNLLQRVDNHQGVEENFSYDKLNRLDVSSGPALVTKTLSYDMHGNITYRSDVGTYTYGTNPHAVASVSGALNASYSYDPNGNMISGNGRTLTYTSFNMPATITGNGYTYTYTYGPDHERMRLMHSTLGTFIYLHPNGKGELLFEKETRLDGLVEHKHYLSISGTAVAVHLTRSDMTQETRYFHHDQIGSLTLITNASGAVIERLSYEAFGKRRFPNGTDDPGNTLFGVTTDRGFTAHEHLDEITLIHMNGRVYDPVLGRFITPDPFIQAPFNLQSHNRYSYVLNNPLRNYDPSGFWSLRKAWREFREEVKEVVQTVVNTAETMIETALDNPIQTIAIVAISVATYGAATSLLGTATLGAGGTTAFATAAVDIYGTVGISLTWAGGAVAGAASGFAAGFVGSGGDLEAAAKGAVSGAILGGVGAAFSDVGPAGIRANGFTQAAAKSVAGGIGAEIQGGNFKDGLYAGLITSAARYTYNNVVNYDVDGLPGGAAVSKDPASLPAAGANNFGTAGIVGRGGLWAEGGTASRFFNAIPGANAVSGFHDVLQVRLDEMGPGLRSGVLNYVGVVPSLAITYAALIDRVPGIRTALNDLSR